MNIEELRNLVEELNLRPKKDFDKMDVKQLSRELRDIMAFEQETFQKLEEFKKNGVEQDLISYAKMVCRNTVGREISEIQEIYLKKIDTEYLNTR